jgi:hypothetical protein
MHRRSLIKFMLIEKSWPKPYATCYGTRPKSGLHPWSPSILLVRVWRSLLDIYR